MNQAISLYLQEQHEVAYARLAALERDACVVLDALLATYTNLDRLKDEQIVLGKKLQLERAYIAFNEKMQREIEAHADFAKGKMITSETVGF